MQVNSKLFFLAIPFLSFALVATPVLAAFNPHPGDTFNYYEVQNLSNGTGDYAGYTEQTKINGTEIINGLTGDGNVSAFYSWTSTWRNSQSQSQNNASSGNFTFSPTTFLYTNGTDDQEGYVNPTVWFCIDPSTSRGSTFDLLNTMMTVINAKQSYYLPSQSRNVYTIFAKGNSSYQRDDAYGQFTATYTWDTYFDPASRYIVGYSYTEQDINGSTGFTFIDTLYITSSSYSLTIVPETNVTTILIVVAIIIVVIIIAVSIILHRRSSKRSNMPPAPHVKPAPNAKCPYCGAAIYIGPENVATCEYCGREVHREPANS